MEESELVDILSNAEFRSIKTKDDIKSTVIKAAHRELMQVAKYALDAMAGTARNKLQVMLPSVSSIEKLYRTENPHRGRLLNFFSHH